MQIEWVPADKKFEFKSSILADNVDDMVFDTVNGLMFVELGASPKLCIQDKSQKPELGLM